MNLPAFVVAAPTVKEPSPVPAPARRDDRARVDERDRAEEDFDRALRQELERKAAAPPPPPPFLPMLMPLQPVIAGEGEAIAAVAARVSTTLTSRAATVATGTVAADAGRDAALEHAAPVARPEDGPVTPIRIVVEPGLPPVQPGEDGPRVALVDFPQMVVGQVRQLVRDQRPLTQLDFQITPPHVGPVNLSISYTQGVVGVQLTALTMQAKQALENQVGTIHQILTAHNLTPGQIKVVTAVGGRGGANGAGMKGDQAGFGFFSGGRRRQPGAEDGTVKAT